MNKYKLIFTFSIVLMILSYILIPLFYPYTIVLAMIGGGSSGYYYAKIKRNEKS